MYVCMYVLYSCHVLFLHILMYFHSFTNCNSSLKIKLIRQCVHVYECWEGGEGVGGGKGKKSGYGTFYYSMIFK